MKKATAPEIIPTKPGTAFAGGLYVARYFDGVTPRALIVAPREDGEFSDIAHADALKKAKAAKIGGSKDWKVPTRLQGLLLWQNRKALPKAEAFAEEWYWLLEQHESDSDSAWYQSFYWGYQDDVHKSYRFRVRLVRSIPI